MFMTYIWIFVGTQKELNLTYIYTNLPVDVIVRLPHPRSGDSQGQETFLAPSADKQTHNYDMEFSNHHSSPIYIYTRQWHTKEHLYGMQRVKQSRACYSLHIYYTDWIFMCDFQPFVLASIYIKPYFFRLWCWVFCLSFFFHFRYINRHVCILINM